ncbi:MAG: class A beta-lactamase-related serine hydrolase [Gemmatimonadota bacterium]|nr:class A beta-lactamase-related serine hydrolase [Gemmatimonadota bacterium]
MRERRGAARLVRVATLALLAALPACARAQGAATLAPLPRGVAGTDTAALHRALDSLAAAHQGTVGYTVHNLETGERLALRGDETFPTASLIKVPILVAVYDLVEKGRISLDDPLTVLAIDQVPGSGILQFMRPGLTITVRDAAWLMTTISDNTATNLLLDRIIIRRVWEKMEALGLPHTKVHSKSFLRISSVAMDSSVKYGLGVTTPNEMARLFELLAQGKAVSPAADSAMVEILAHNDDHELLQRFAGGVRAARKTGATDEVRAECSLWFLPSRVVGCVMTKGNKDTRWVIDSEPQLTMARMGELIVKAWHQPEKERTASPD